MAPGTASRETPSCWLWPVFSLMGYRNPATVPLQLLLAGDIETNPGPYTCPICSTQRTSSRAGGGSVRCSSCGEWIHLRCTTLNRSSNYTMNWICTPCQNTYTQQASTPHASPIRPTQHIAANQTQDPMTQPPTQPQSPHTPIHSPTSPQTRLPQPHNRHTPSPTHNTRNNNIPRNERRNINVLQLNIDGLRNKHIALKHFLHKHRIHIALIQETKLKHTHKTPTIPNYTPIRQDRQHGEGGGLITYIHHNISYIEKTQHIRTLTHADRHTELQAFYIKTGHDKQITIINTYIPPEHSPGLPPNYTIRLHSLNTLQDILLGGDFNAKHTDWYTQQTNTQRGEEICTQLDQLHILNNTDSHTHIPHQANFNCTSPDITFCSPNLAPSITWQTVTDLSSDHLPIIITLRKTTDTHSYTRKTHTNYKQAAWDGFRETTEAHFQELNNIPITSEQILNNTTKHFNYIINDADKRHIPKGNRTHYNPNYSPEIKRLIRERNNLRDTPTPHTHILP